MMYHATGAIKLTITIPLNNCIKVSGIKNNFFKVGPEDEAIATLRIVSGTGS